MLINMKKLTLLLTICISIPKITMPAQATLQPATLTAGCLHLAKKCFTAFSRFPGSLLRYMGKHPVQSIAAATCAALATTPKIRQLASRISSCIATSYLKDAIDNHSSLTVRLLIAAGADCNPPWVETPLMLACEKGDTTIVKMLIAARADVNTKTSYGATPLSHACLFARSAIVKILLKNGAAVDPKNNTQETPLHSACQAVGTIDDGEKWATIIETLCTSGADVNAKDIYGRTPLHYAANFGSNHLSRVRALLNAHADVNALDNTGKTPLDSARDSYASPQRNAATIALLTQASAHK